MPRHRYYDIRDFSDFPGMGSWVDDLIGAAKQVVPENTVASKVLQGDVVGAAGSTAQYIAGVGGGVAIKSTSPKMSKPGAGSTWILPIAIGIGGLILFRMWRR